MFKHFINISIVEKHRIFVTLFLLSKTQTIQLFMNKISPNEEKKIYYAKFNDLFSQHQNQYENNNKSFMIMSNNEH